jgi:hypothetical protein
LSTGYQWSYSQASFLLASSPSNRLYQKKTVCQKSVPVIATAISNEWASNLPADHPCYATREDNTGQEEEKEEEKEEEVVACTKLTRRRPTGAAQQLSCS